MKTVGTQQRGFVMLTGHTWSYISRSEIFPGPFSKVQERSLDTDGVLDVAFPLEGLGRFVPRCSVLRLPEECRNCKEHWQQIHDRELRVSSSVSTWTS